MLSDIHKMPDAIGMNPFETLSHVRHRQESAQRVAVYLLCAWMWGMGWFVAGTMLYEGISSGWMLYTNAATALVACVAIWATRQGHGRAVSVVLIAFVFAATAGIHFGGRNYTPASLLNIAVLTFFAGWALSLTGLVIVVLLCQALLMLLVFQGEITWGVLLPLMFSSLFFGLAMVFARRAYGQHLDQLAQATEKIAAHEAQQRMLSSVVEQSPYSVAVVDTQGAIVYTNAVFLKRAGYSQQEVLGRKSREISVAGMDDETYAFMRQIIRTGHVWHGVLRNANRAGELLIEQVMVTPIHDEAGALRYFVEAKLDVSERVYAQERIHQLMNYDKLTQLPNRFALQRKLDDLLLQERERLGHEPSNHAAHVWHGLLLLDLDRFSTFSLAHGSEWGGALLVAIAMRLRALQSTHAAMWVARYTVDRFAVVLEGVGSTRFAAQAHAQAQAEKLQSEMTRIALLQPQQETMEVSFGVGLTVFPFTEPSLQADNSDRIVRRATLALARAKQAGLKQVAAYTENMAERAELDVKIERGLHAALAQGQLRMYVQPQYGQSGQVVGLEALVRWLHPEQGLISPGQFIPVAEQSGLIVPLGDWMLEQACALLAHPMMQSQSCSVAVNISAQQFMRPDFVASMRALLERTQVPAQRLVLEVTESMLLADMQAAVQTMHQLQALGIQLALDDFGTGYSSLSYLQRLPIHELKIDQSFIQHLDPEGVSGALVQAVLMVAKKLNLRVVAEGVERVEDAALLQAWSPAIVCQGYLYSRPIPVEAWLLQLAQKSQS